MDRRSRVHTPRALTPLSNQNPNQLHSLAPLVSLTITPQAKYREKAKLSAIDVMNQHILTPNPAYQRADGVTVGKDADQVTKKVLRVLEVKLDKLMQQRSEVEISNQKLRTQIDHMRQVRMQTDNSHTRFESSMAATKEKIETILASATDVIEQREMLLELKVAATRCTALRYNHAHLNLPLLYPPL